MRIITLSCANCGTIVAANELESNRVMKCPRDGCQSVLRFGDLDEAEQEFFIEHRDQYQI
jgi:phage FluMu protein Com